MSPNRRAFMQMMSAVALAPMLDSRAAAGGLPRLDHYPRAGDPVLKELAAIALDAAKGAGASYADLRLTLTRHEWCGSKASRAAEDERGAFGVRALADGAWGFVAGPVWSKEAAARLGREAAVQAKANARGGSPGIAIGPPPVASGVWQTPIVRDPFTVPMAEKMDVLYALNEIPSRLDRDADLTVGSHFEFWRQDKTFASTDGSFATQTLYRAKCEYEVSAKAKTKTKRTSNSMQPQAGGWEAFSQARITDEVPRLVEEALLLQDAEPIMPDRYDVVFDGLAMARIMGHTIAMAGELDRVLGYEANASGTSYLAPPETTLGKMGLGSSLLNVTCNRSRPTGASSVRWDDEGVVPEDYTLIKDGVPVDYHTSRAFAPTLSPWYAQTGRSVRSHGCAGGESARGIPLVQPPNVEMQPDSTNTTFDDLIAGLEKGLVICGGRAYSDRQQLNGELNGEFVYEVHKGKRGRCFRNTEVLFRAPEFWRNLAAIGGKNSQVTSGLMVKKGQPEQEYMFGLAAVPALVRKVAVTDIMRKA